MFVISFSVKKAVLVQSRGVLPQVQRGSFCGTEKYDESYVTINFVSFTIVFIAKKIMKMSVDASLMCCFRMGTCRGKIQFKSRPQSGILVPVSGCCQKFRCAPLSFLYGSPFAQGCSTRFK